MHDGLFPATEGKPVALGRGKCLTDSGFGDHCEGNVYVRLPSWPQSALEPLPMSPSYTSDGKTFEIRFMLDSDVRLNRADGRVEVWSPGMNTVTADMSLKRRRPVVVISPPK